MKKLYIVILIITTSLLLYGIFSKIDTTQQENTSSDIETTLQENTSSDIETTLQENTSSDIETTLPENTSSDIETTLPENTSSDIETTLPENTSSDIETTPQENISSDIEKLYIQNEKQIEKTIFNLQYKDIIEIHGEPIEEKFFRISHHTPPGRCLLLIYDDIQYLIFDNNLDITKEKLKAKNQHTRFLITSKDCILSINISVGMSLDEIQEKNQFLKMNNIFFYKFIKEFPEMAEPFHLPTEFKIKIYEKRKYDYHLADANSGQEIILIFDDENFLQCILSK